MRVATAAGGHLALVGAAEPDELGDDGDACSWTAGPHLALVNGGA